ncbi:hypothetical protein FACS189443_4330 [Planctomycetales bacterium]|nr:hypothetical protein FACS189443_4330 [Planctomycetales bacterium]
MKRNVKKIAIKTKTGVMEINTKLDFIPKGTIFSTICRLQKELKSTGFPYKIQAIKIFSTRKIKGYALKRNGIAK